jgi:hypothetical protein
MGCAKIKAGAAPVSGKRAPDVGEKGKELGMPLSEDEQRILHQIEQQFYESDPDFAYNVSQTSLYRHAFRNIKWAALGLVAGLVFLLLTLSVHVLLAFTGFLMMLACAFVIERNARAMGRAGLAHVTSSMRAAKIGERLGGAGERMRHRFRRGERE